MASLFLSSIVIFLSAVSAIESAALDVLPVHAFHKTSNSVLPNGVPIVPIHPLSEPILPPKPNHVLPTGEPVHVYPLSEPILPPNGVYPLSEPILPPNGVYPLSEPVLPPKSNHVYPLSEPVLPPKLNHVLPTGEPAPVHAIPRSRKIKF
uniref:Merozoite surface protein CMZ-8-like n=1 Tax=Cicer arietinum TaxID=3827 RepID=A0A3Q7XQK9_CICAR|nr:merozoite surface protein CMZ-8-like [Cicer arietinum]